MVSQERLIKQIYFPKLVLPLAASMSGVVSFAFGLIPLFAMMLLLYPHASPWLLLIPVIAVVQLLFTTGLAILVSAVNVFYRDIGNLSRHLHPLLVLPLARAVRGGRGGGDRRQARAASACGSRSTRGPTS